MTTALLLVAFCATMAAIAIARLALRDERDPVDVGVALIVVGSTSLALLWAALTESWLLTIGRFALAGVGSVLVVAGVVLLFRYLDRSPEYSS
ncbi:hypothetical protein ACFO5R_18995 [Halosolutus amylolyticus]|uniref:Uncharacterized protein n=1 Tax=Halosolutus amylolyticus TaxID=2932267 RepID=A0ABD5PTZ1_9EURY|nr:hypothetical protein [Halosolutus amylolyticus]